MNDIPMLYLSNYFSDLRSQVDQYFNKKGINKSSLNADLSDTKTSTKTDLIKSPRLLWTQMTEKVNEFEKECLNKLNSYQNDLKNQFSKEIHQIEIRLNCEKESFQLDQIDNDLQAALFPDKTMIFFTGCKFDDNCQSDDEQNSVTTPETYSIPKLLVIKNEFFNNQMISDFKLDYDYEISLQTEPHSNKVRVETAITKDYLVIIMLKEKLRDIYQAGIKEIDIYDDESISIDGDRQITSIETFAFKKFKNLNFLSVSDCNFGSLEVTTFEGLNNLERLFLNNNCLNQIKPKLLDPLTNLVELVLNDNKISKLEDETFIYLTNLIDLFIENNEIDEIKPLAFKGLINLERCYLNNNKISSISCNTFNEMAKLNLLDLSNNFISTVGEFVFNGLLNLQYLDLKANKLTKIELNSFSNLTKLVKLDLSNNEISLIDESAFEGLDKLVYLYLQNNKIELIHLVELQNLKNLRKLNLKNNPLNSTDKIAIMGDIEVKIG